MNRFNYSRPTHLNVVHRSMSDAKGNPESAFRVIASEVFVVIGQDFCDRRAYVA